MALSSPEHVGMSSRNSVICHAGQTFGTAVFPGDYRKTAVPGPEEDREIRRCCRLSERFYDISDFGGKDGYAKLAVQFLSRSVRLIFGGMNKHCL